MFGFAGGCSDDHGLGDGLPSRRAVLGAASVLGLGVFDLVDNVAMAEIESGSPGPAGPRVHTRREWGARKPRKATKILKRVPDRIIVHHTATPNTRDYSLAHAYRLSRDIQRFHMRSRKWNDTGQQLTISRGGHVMEGRDGSLAAILSGRHVLGAQALHHNDHTIGIENEGNYMRAPVPGSLWTSLVTVCAWLCAEYRLDPNRAIVGHRDYGKTSCPGDVLYARLPELRRAVAMYLSDGGPKPKPRPEPPVPDVPEPEIMEEPMITPSSDLDVPDDLPPMRRPPS
ncbi:peptidoglycan recognition family protein [Spirillospora sp. NPDC047279]|uniref:peptidoglycan recognition protein family protein n=1 Tax=Spirillospora sp. NPDC047279 TaxID=3155478 RepID=UPI00340E81CE